MSLPSRLLRALLAALAAAAVSWPLAGFTASAEKGPVLSLLPALRIGGVVLAVGVGYALLLEVLRLSRAAESAAALRGALRSRPAAGWTLAAAFAAFLAAVPLFASRSWTSNLVEALVFATIAVGLNISMGMAGLLVLGHAAFWAVGSYTSVLLVLHGGWNFWPAFLAGGAAAAGAGFVVGLPALRLRGDYLALVTLGFGEAVRWILKNETRWTGGDAGVPGSEVPGSLLEARPLPGGWTPWQPRTLEECFWFALGLLVLCVACVTLLTRSRFGRALFALREDETAARCMGIDTVRVKLLAFTASAFWAGLAGAVHPVFRGQITPEMFDFNASVLFVAMVVLGGLGSIPGSVAGAAVLFLLPQLLRDKLPAIQEYRMLLFGAVLAGLMVVRPEGLFGRPREEDGDGDGEGTKAADGGAGARGGEA